MPHIDDLDSLGEAAVIYGEQVPAGQREEVADATRLQRFRDKASPMLHWAASLVPGAGLEPASPLRGSAF